jgi:hypothetical protein
MNKKELMRFIRGREDSRQRHLGLKLRHDARRIQVPMGVSNWGHLQAASPPNSALIRTRAPPRNFNSILTRFSTAEGGALFLPRPALFPTKDTQHAHPTHAPPLRFRSGRGGDRMTKSDQRVRAERLQMLTRLSHPRHEWQESVRRSATSVASPPLQSRSSRPSVAVK